MEQRESWQGVIGGKAQRSVGLGIVEVAESSMPSVPKALVEAGDRRLGGRHRGL